MDWKQFWLAILVAMPPTLAGMAALIQGIRTHRTFNSKMDEFLKLTKDTAYAQGKQDEKAGIAPPPKLSSQELAPEIFTKPKEPLS